jgi:hypothetical protein
MTYPSAPWPLQGDAVHTLQLMDRVRARAFVPSALDITSVLPAARQRHARGCGAGVGCTGFSTRDASRAGVRSMPPQTIPVHRAPVMTLWAAVVAERLGHAPDAALTRGKAVAGLNAHAKGRRVGRYEAPPDQTEAPTSRRRPTGGPLVVTVRGRPVPAVQTSHGLRATSHGQPLDPGRVRRALERAFGGDLAAVQAALEARAQASSRDELAARADARSEPFRPAVPAGKQGWGATGELRLDAIRALAQKGPGSGWSTTRPADRGRLRRSARWRGRPTALAPYGCIARHLWAAAHRERWARRGRARFRTMWTWSEIETQWLGGSRGAAPPDIVGDAFEVTEAMLGADWVQSQREHAGARLSGAGPAVAVVTMGLKLRRLQQAQGLGNVLKRIRSGDRAARAELTAAYLCVTPASQVEVEFGAQCGPKGARPPLTSGFAATAARGCMSR